MKTSSIQGIKNEEFVMLCGFIESPPLGLSDGRLLFKLRQNATTINAVLPIDHVQDFSSMWTQSWDVISEGNRQPVPAFFSYCFATFDFRSTEKVIHIQSKSLTLYGDTARALADINQFSWNRDLNVKPLTDTIDIPSTFDKLSLASYLEEPPTTPRRGGHYSLIMDIKLGNTTVFDVSSLSLQCSKGLYGHYMTSGKICGTCGIDGGTIKMFTDHKITIYDGVDEVFSNPHTLLFSGKCLENLFSCTVEQSSNAKHVKQSVADAKSKYWMLLVYKSDKDPIVVKVKELNNPTTWRSENVRTTERAAKRTKGWMS